MPDEYQKLTDEQMEDAIWLLSEDPTSRPVITEQNKHQLRLSKQGYCLLDESGKEWPIVGFQEPCDDPDAEYAKYLAELEQHA